MAGDTANPRVWVNADVFVGPVGTPGPTDTITALDAAFDPLGLLSEDGLTESRADNVTNHYAHGGILVRTTRSQHERTFKVTALEDNATVWALVNPGSTKSSSAGTTVRTVVIPQPSPQAFVIELHDGNIIKRRHIPKAEVTEVGDQTISDNELAMYELTIKVYPGADGTLYYDVTNDPQAI
jgi:hypothetical protein